jgi:Uma2 family endonuclease
MAADPTIAPHWRFTVDEYELMGKVGILAENDRTELLDGEIYGMSPIGPKHAMLVRRITRQLYRVAGDMSIHVQDPIRLDPRSEPQPDLVVARPRHDEYESGHPTARDILLVIEVSDSTLALDRGVKLPIYAEQGIAEVWIVDVKAEVVHVHTDPEGRGYRTVRSLGIGDVLEPTTIENVRISVADVL